MGGCCSDVRGGQQAVGGAQQATGNNSGGGNNDAVDFFFKTKGVHALCTPIELSLSATNLRDRDIVSKSDPMAVVYKKNMDGSLEELGRSEVVMNSLDPAWIEKINVSYQFEILQPLVFHVYDVDTKYHNIPAKTLKLKDQEFLGEASCVLSEILTKQSRRLTLKLQNKHGRSGLKNLGTLTVHAEETVASRNAVEITFRCSHLENKDLFSMSDPFLRLSRIVENGGSVPICKTEVVNNNLNPLWKPLSLTTQQFGSKVLKSQLFVDRIVGKKLNSFLDYISNGFELNFMVAVDFTASNGNPRSQDSLHYIDPSGRLNAYQQAIMEVGEVIQFYDSDRRFPAWGFGGRTYDGSVSHCFNLNGGAGSVEVEGVEGIMASYASALHNVTLAGPTLFGQVINTAAEIASRSLSYNSSKYFVLLIITDGVVTDLQETKDALVRASDLPLSILIVGVGGADFKQMEILDADTGRRLESSTGRVATRDIVHQASKHFFVTYIFLFFSGAGGQITVVQGLLEELPGQFLTYMRSRNIEPHAANLPPPPLAQDHHPYGV
ncbi:hypothetical protein RHMOL_Rhmol07G0226100 [Rhododendron molle]|uniref:Uncharacterized protein n=1 Tax=Rhododendron molle TaxID=49168 RepID=A0ACC0N5H2_RHOML|nr:hypothetical protein RHMOL_Rhmol07G0226100 [Rhododendron molle]